MIEYFFKMIRYNEWADKISLLSIQSQGINNEGIMKILSHLLLAEQIWVLRMQKGEYENLNFWKVLSLGECSELIEENSSIYFSYLSKMKERDLKKIIRYKNSQRIEFTNTIEDILTHISHHSAYHRAQIARETRDLGFNPPLTDYIVFLREISK